MPQGGSSVLYRSLFPWTLTLLLGVLVVGGFGLTASAQDGADASTPTCTPTPGVACVRVPAALQEELAKVHLAVAEAKLVVLRSSTFQGGSAVQSTRVAALNTEISTLKARIAAGFTDYLLSMPYATARGPGQHGIAFSKFTYRNPPEHNPASTSVAMESADPTQIVLWGEATNENVAKAFKGTHVLKNQKRVVEKKFTRPPDNAYRWEDDLFPNPFRESAPQYVAMQNSADPVAGEWVWVKSTGLHPTGDIAATDTRHHMRFFSSSDTKRENVSALGPQKGHFEHWTVIAAHHEDPTPVELTDEFLERLAKNPVALIDFLGPFPLTLIKISIRIGRAGVDTLTAQSLKETLAKAGLSHNVFSWNDGQERVVDSITIPSAMVGGRQGMSWVKEIETRDWDNQGVQQKVNYTLDGYIIKMAAPVATTVSAPSKPAAPTLTATGRTIVVSKPVPVAGEGPTWFDYQYKGQGGGWKFGGRDIVTVEDVITSLKYDTTYQVRVRKWNARDKSDWSDASTITTEQEPPCQKAVPYPSRNEGLVADCEVLLAAKDALQGDSADSNKRVLNWSGDLAIGEWEGLAFTNTKWRRGTSRVLGLMLPGKTGSFLKGSIPPALGQLTELNHLVLGSNQLDGDIPAELASLTKLRQLSLDRNQLTGEIPAALDALDKLRVLELNDNFLTGAFPWWLYDLNLGILKLAPVPLFLEQNPWRGCIPPALFNVDNNDLADLNLPPCAAAVICEYGTAVPEPADNRGLVEDCVALYETLEALGARQALNWSEAIPIAQWNGVTVEAPAEGMPERVTKLRLHGPNAGDDQGEVPEFYARARTYRGEGFTGSIPAALGELDALTVLSLRGNGLSGKIPEALAQLTNLTKLRLRDNNFTSTSCIPPALFKVDDHDLDQLDIDKCLPEVSITAGAPVEEGAPATFTVSRTGDTAEALVVLASVTDGEGDFLEGTPATRVTIPADAANATLEVATNDDDVDEDDGAVTVTIGASDAYDIDAANASAAVTVRDNDEATMVSITADETSVEEGEDADFTVTRTGSTTAVLTVLVSVSDGDGDFLDGTPDSQVTIPAGATSAKLAVATDDDDTDEENGSVAVTIGTSDDYAIDGDAGSASVTVRDNDTHPCENGTTVRNPRFNRGLVADCTALLAARDTLQGEGVSVLNWSGTTSITQWTGVRVIQSRVWWLNLHDSGLTGRIPAELGGLSELFILTLSENELTGGIPAELGGLSKLYSLSLFDNQLGGRIPGSLQDLSKLRTLTLGSNSFTGCIPPLLRNVNRNDVASLNLPDCQFGVETTTFKTTGNAGYAKATETITVEFTTSEELAATPSATIAGQRAAVTGSGRSWSATYTVTTTTPNGEARFDLGEIRNASGTSQNPAAVGTGIVVDTVNPTATASTATTSGNPGYAMAGDTITVPFTTSEALAEAPAATIAGEDATVSGSGTSWSAAYTVAAADTNGAARFAMGEIHDRAGNAATPAAVVTAVRIDTVVPTVTKHSATTSTGTTTVEAGDAITVAFTTSEALAATPAATIAGEAATVSGSGTSWTAAWTVEAGVDVADARFDLATIRDAAGNETDPASVATGITVVDDTAPTVTVGTATTDGPSGYAKADETIRVPFTVSEALASPPTATIAGQSAAMSGAGLSWEASYTVVSTTPNGPAAFVLAEISDRAGNRATPGVVATGITVDTVAPTVTEHTFTTTAAAGTRSGAGDVITVTFTTSEALHLKPWASIVGETATVSGSGTNWTASYTIKDGDNAANAAFNLGPLRDAAGNSDDPDPVSTGIAVKTIELRTLTTSVSPADGGTVQVTIVAEVQGGQQTPPFARYREWSYTKGTKVKAIAQAGQHYRFKQWSGDACEGEGVTNPHTAADGCVVTLNGNKAVTAIFELRNYVFTVTADAGGTVSGGGSFVYGSTPTGTVSWSRDSYTFDRWTGGPCTSTSEDTTSASCTVSLTGPRQVHAHLDERPCHIATATSGLGTAGGDATVHCGVENATIWARPGTDQCFTGWSPTLGVRGATPAQACVSGRTTLTVPKPTVDWTYTANFKRGYTVTATHGANGGVAGGGRYVSGGTVTLTATPDTDYEVASWSGACSGSGTSCDVLVNADKAARVTFVAQCAVTATAGAGGSVNPASGTVNCGSAFRTTATAAAGYCYSHVSGGRLVGGTASEEVIGQQQSCQTSRTVTLGTLASTTPGAYAYTVHFKVKPTYTFTVTADAGGTPSGGGSGLEPGSTATGKVTWNNVSYSFTSWTGDACTATNASTSSATCAVTMNANKSVHANLSKRNCRVAASSGTGGTATGGGTVHCGVGSTTVRASASVGYCFSAWSPSFGVSGQSSSTCTVNNTLSVKRPSVDITYTANFTARSYKLTVNNGTGSGSYPARSYAVATAPAWKCLFGVAYNFSGWTGTTVTSRSARLYMNRDRTVTANFATRTTRSCFGSAAGDEGATGADGPWAPITPETEPLPAEAEASEESVVDGGAAESQDDGGADPEPEGDGSGEQPEGGDDS